MTDDEERSELTRHLFAVVTGLLKDAAAMTAVAQGRHEHAAQRARAAIIETITAKTLTILSAIRTIWIERTHRLRADRPHSGKTGGERSVRFGGAASGSAATNMGLSTCRQRQNGLNQCPL